MKRSENKVLENVKKSRIYIVISQLLKNQLLRVVNKIRRGLCKNKIKKKSPAKKKF